MTTIRTATLDDVTLLYEIGKATKEFQVSQTEEFMSFNEFSCAISNEKSIFLLAEEKEKIQGFIYASAKDIDGHLIENFACLVYLTVLPEYRKQSIAKMLYEECEKTLKEKGIRSIYCWANANNPTILSFMEKQNFVKGHEYVWMDKKIE